MHKPHPLLFVVIALTALLFRMQSLGWSNDASLIVPLGVIAVFGVVALTRQVFNWQMGITAGILLAGSSWHAEISDINSLAVLSTTAWGLYTLWRGLATNRIGFFILTGILFGLGVYTHLVGAWMIVALIPILFTYQSVLKIHFEHEQYDHAREKVLRGIGASVLVLVIVIIPGLIKLYTSDEGISKVFEFILPIGEGVTVVIRNFFHMFGSFDNREAFLFWPVAVLAAVGLARGIFKLSRSKKDHGHLSTAHTTLLAWFIVGLISTVLGGTKTGMLVAGTAATIYASQGIWWIFEWLEQWYSNRDEHIISSPSNHFRRISMYESTAVSAMAMAILVAAIVIAEYFRL